MTPELKAVRGHECVENGAFLGGENSARPALSRTYARESRKFSASSAARLADRLPDGPQVRGESRAPQAEGRGFDPRRPLFTAIPLVLP
jgi:hypothetical protein